MESKHRADDICKMLYILYTIFLIYPLKSLISSGLLSTNIRFFEIINNIEIGYGLEFFGFQFMFLFLLYIAISSESKNIVVYDDEYKIRKLKDRLIPYKLFVIFNIVACVILVILLNDKYLLAPSILLIVTSTMIYYAKDTYLKSYLFNRQLNWIESITGEKYDDTYIDSKKWRYKIWCESKEYIKFSYRKTHITLNILNIIIFSIVFRFWTIIGGYFLLKNILELLENIFSVFTSIEGVCTGIYEERTRSRTYYRVVITDYDNKREVKVKMDEGYYIQNMDRLTVVHGVFSKRLISINNINIDKQVNIIPTLIILSLIGFPVIDNFIDEDINDNYISVNTEEYIDYDERQKLENDRELISLNNLINYRTINISKKESTEDVAINLDKLYLGENASKIYFSITNNSDRGMVINFDYNTIIASEEGRNSNILLPNKTYDIEMDILYSYNKEEHNLLCVELAYTLSETILNEYLDFSYYNHYPLNVIDKEILVYIDLNNESVDIDFVNYDQFYTKQDKITYFIPVTN